jgi:ABC-2 type transport system ATP-binding protein
MTQDTVVTVRGLTKSYGPVQALRGVDLEVGRGEIFGFLGPNGAGKTTTIRCLLDLIRPDGGTARVLGMDPQADAVSIQARTGYLPGELHLDENLTAKAQLRFLNDMRGGRAKWDTIHELAARLDLDLERPIKNLSKGNKQKVGVVQALMHQPELLLLDEPTMGLDPIMQNVVLGMIREAKETGTTVFFSSHIMSEVEAVAERVGIIRQGKIVEVAEIASLVDRSLHHITIRFKEPVDSSQLASVLGVRMLSQLDGIAVTLEVEGEMDDLVKALGQFPVSKIETARPSLEQVFMTYYRDRQEG